MRPLRNTIKYTKPTLPSPKNGSDGGERKTGKTKKKVVAADFFARIKKRKARASDVLESVARAVSLGEGFGAKACLAGSRERNWRSGGAPWAPA